MSQTDLAFVSSEFDIFAPKPVQLAIQDTKGVHFKPIASIDQSDLEFLIPADYDTYIDTDFKHCQRQTITARNAKRKKKAKRTLPRKRRVTIKQDIFHNLHHSLYDHVSDRHSFRE